MKDADYKALLELIEEKLAPDNVKECIFEFRAMGDGSYGLLDARSVVRRIFIRKFPNHPIPSILSFKRG